MKRVIAAALLLVFCLPLFGCSKTHYGLSEGAYRSTLGIDINVIFYMGDGKQEFVFNYTQNPLGSDMAGTFEIKNGKVICTAGDSVAVFEIVDNDTLRFLQTESKNLEESKLTDGTEFIRDQEG